MVAAFCGFMAGSIVGLQEFGAGLAVAILLDATIVRAMMVPALMAVMGEVQLVAAGGGGEDRPRPALAAPRPWYKFRVAESASLILPDGTERALAPEFAVGRAEDNDLTIEKPTVSRHHLVVSEEGDRWFVEDRGSFNGTFLNGSRIQAGSKMPLRHGDRIGLGAESVVFSAPGSLVDPEVTTALQVGRPALTRPLSPFQRQVVEALCAGWLAGGSLDDLPTNDEIAARLGHARRDRDGEGCTAAGVREGRLDGGLAVREAAGAVQDRPPARLGLTLAPLASRGTRPP